MRPYRVVEETDTHVTYEYRTAYTWMLYAALIVLLIGIVMPDEAISTAGTVAVGLYFVAKFGLGSEINGKIRKAMASNAVQISGNKASFGNPLQIRVPK